MGKKLKSAAYTLKPNLDKARNAIKPEAAVVDAITIRADEANSSVPQNHRTGWCDHAKLFRSHIVITSYGVPSNGGVVYGNLLPLSKRPKFLGLMSKSTNPKGDEYRAYSQANNAGKLFHRRSTLKTDPATNGIDAAQFNLLREACTFTHPSGLYYSFSAGAVSNALAAYFEVMNGAPPVTLQFDPCNGGLHMHRDLVQLFKNTLLGYSSYNTTIRECDSTSHINPHNLTIHDRYDPDQAHNAGRTMVSSYGLKFELHNQLIDDRLTEGTTTFNNELGVEQKEDHFKACLDTTVVAARDVSGLDMSERNMKFVTSADSCVAYKSGLLTIPTDASDEVCIDQLSVDHEELMNTIEDLTNVNYIRPVKTPTNHYYSQQQHAPIDISGFPWWLVMVGYLRLTGTLPMSALCGALRDSSPTESAAQFGNDFKVEMQLHQTLTLKETTQRKDNHFKGHLVTNEYSRCLMLDRIVQREINRTRLNEHISRLTIRHDGEDLDKDALYARGLLVSDAVHIDAPRVRTASEKLAEYLGDTINTPSPAGMAVPVPHLLLHRVPRVSHSSPDSHNPVFTYAGTIPVDGRKCVLDYVTPPVTPTSTLTPTTHKESSGQSGIKLHVLVKYSDDWFDTIYHSHLDAHEAIMFDQHQLRFIKDYRKNPRRSELVRLASENKNNKDYLGAINQVMSSSNKELWREQRLEMAKNGHYIDKTKNPSYIRAKRLGLITQNNTRTAGTPPTELYMTIDPFISDADKTDNNYVCVKKSPHSPTFTLKDRTDTSNTRYNSDVLKPVLDFAQETVAGLLNLYPECRSHCLEQVGRTFKGRAQSHYLHPLAPRLVVWAEHAHHDASLKGKPDYTCDWILYDSERHVLTADGRLAIKQTDTDNSNDSSERDESESERDESESERDESERDESERDESDNGFKINENCLLT